MTAIVGEWSVAFVVLVVIVLVAFECSKVGGPDSDPMTSDPVAFLAFLVLVGLRYSDTHFDVGSYFEIGLEVEALVVVRFAFDVDAGFAYEREMEIFEPMAEPYEWEKEL